MRILFYKCYYLYEFGTTDKSGLENSTVTGIDSFLITVAKDEDDSHAKTPIDKIAHEIFEFADETVGHAEGVPREKLILACYDKLGTLMAQWAQKLDKIEVKKIEPAWLKEVTKAKEQTEGVSLVAYDAASLGFEVEGLYFGQESREKKIERRLSDGHSTTHNDHGGFQIPDCFLRKERS